MRPPVTAAHPRTARISLAFRGAILATARVEPPRNLGVSCRSFSYGCIYYSHASHNRRTNPTIHYQQA
jgi:hypothetical protein